MIINIIIFLVATFLAFAMLAYRAWQLETFRFAGTEETKNIEIRIPFRRIEKTILFLIKRLIQSIIITVVKYWLIINIKIKNKFAESWPKIHDYLLRKRKKIVNSNGNSYLRRAIIESKIKIRHVKEKVKRENEIE